jgi:hypothetical protein
MHKSALTLLVVISIVVTPAICQTKNVIRTGPNAKTMGLDQKTHKLYLSSGEIETIPPADRAQKPQRKVVPGTFEVLVAGPK